MNLSHGVSLVWLGLAGAGAFAYTDYRYPFCSFTVLVLITDTHFAALYCLVQSLRYHMYVAGLKGRLLY